MIKLLYAGAANLAQPGDGMDVGARCHFEELSDDPDIDVTAISVSPRPIDPATPPRRPVLLVSADPMAGQTARQRLFRKLGLLARGGILFQTGFMSQVARTALRDRLATKPDILFIDHIAALANISLAQLVLLRLAGRTKIFIVSYDISSELLRDRARVSPSKIKSLLISLHASHCHLYENLVYALAHRVFFISTDDRDRFRYVRQAKTDAMCPVIDVPPGRAVDEGFGDYLLFVGSPSFFPNAFALDWIVQRLAPELLNRLPSLRILLVGKGTDGNDPARPPNVTGLGFVDEDRLHRLLHGACGTLSPVVHGSGIKIKVLEAIAAGCAIFATERSLRGYEFMHIEPLLDVDDAASSADRVAEIVGDPARLAAYEDQIAERWQQFRLASRGRLASSVKGLFGPER